MKDSIKTFFGINSTYSFYTPSIGGCCAMLGMFILGSLLASVLSSSVLIFKNSFPMEIIQTFAYIVTFVPAMIFAALQSKTNSFFCEGYALDSNNFGKLGGWKAAGLAVIAAIAVNYILDILAYVLPQMPNYLQESMKVMVEGNIFFDFLCVSIFAPFFEEWFCRGGVLRSLLNCRRKDGSKGFNPVLAIIISSAVFALIHGNIWQGIIDFLIGCLMGFIYYKTGSLKHTMLMHFAINTLILIVSQFSSSEGNGYYIEDMGPLWYWIVFAVCAVALFFAIRCFCKIKCERPQGNCDIINPSDISDVTI